MFQRTGWLIYGANGYTGKLVAQEAKRRRMTPILAARDERAVVALAEELDLPQRVFDLTDRAAISEALANVGIVVHCAGPFAATMKPMIDACLASRAHYLDVNSEIDAFVHAEREGARAKSAKIVVCPGVGFDVLPTDCLAACLKEALPDATHLALGFQGLKEMSPGTVRTSARELCRGGRVRENGTIVRIPLASRLREIDFGDGRKFAVAIPWGDVATAYFTTGIPNIEIYIASSLRAASKLRRLERMLPLLSLPLVAPLVERIAATSGDARQHGVSASAPTFVWGEARDAKGAIRSARMTTTQGYGLAVDSILSAVNVLMSQPPAGGYYTPSQLLGSRAIERLPGSSPIAIE
jgi:short subunit dehydrogenase-like uncharacterized protein